MKRVLRDVARIAILRRFLAGRTIDQLAREYGRIAVLRTLRKAVR